MFDGESKRSIIMDQIKALTVTVLSEREIYVMVMALKDTYACRI